MTEEEERERYDARYAALTRRARALFAKGSGPEEVLRECYGVSFPAEFYALRPERAGRPHIMAHFTNLPWYLTDATGSPPTAIGLVVPAEARLLDIDPDLVPLVQLVGQGTKLDGSLLCYRLTELRGGSTAVYACRRYIRRGEEPPRGGASLIEVLHRHHTEFAEHEEWLLDQPTNRGFGAIDEQSVNEARALLERVQELWDGIG
ncbi:hypothetical protein [Streptomyces sp. NPDC050504]|uniref:hypothetical protein n=1 Tax=Streptomyces sp. NPDC050504 TaxID=3365618 RepID=UPI0037A66E73